MSLFAQYIYIIFNKKYIEDDDKDIIHHSHKCLHAQNTHVIVLLL